METETPRTVESAAREVAARLSPPLEHARESLSDLNSRLTRFIKDQPGTCLLAAMALGFVVGRVASR